MKVWEFQMDRAAHIAGKSLFKKDWKQVIPEERSPKFAWSDFKQVNCKYVSIPVS